MSSSKETYRSSEKKGTPGDMKSNRKSLLDYMKMHFKKWSTKKDESEPSFTKLLGKLQKARKSLIVIRNKLHKQRRKLDESQKALVQVTDVLGHPNQAQVSLKFEEMVLHSNQTIQYLNDAICDYSKIINTWESTVGPIDKMESYISCTT